MLINMQQANNLRNHLLIAMPGLKDPLFEGAVVYICEHNEEGAMGLVINKEMPVELHDVCEQLEIPYELTTNSTILNGGPVSQEHGFILHRQSGAWDSTFSVSKDSHLTSSKEILKAIAAGNGPDHYKITLGYAGWDKEQLEEELGSNAWLTIEATPELLFETDVNDIYQNSLAKLGVSLQFLSSQKGHA